MARLVQKKARLNVDSTRVDWSGDNVVGEVGLIFWIRNGLMYRNRVTPNWIKVQLMHQVKVELQLVRAVVLFLLSNSQ